MRPPDRAPRRAPLLAAVALLLLLALPVVRHSLEARMTLHMLVQFPLLVWAGWLLATALPGEWVRRLNAFNVHGLAGLLFIALVLAVWMVPRALDLSLVDTRIESAKGIAWALVGLALRLSWRQAGLVLQGFFLGNVLPMTAVAGYLYENAPVRVCNAYLQDDQVQLGRTLTWLSLSIAAWWMAGMFRALMRAESHPGVTPFDAQ